MSWVLEELTNVDMGDKRLDERCRILLSSFYKSPVLSIPSSCKGWHETIAAYRFFNNDKVTAQDILTPHRDSTLQRISQQEVVLLAQDTTELDYSKKQEKMKTLGVLNKEERRGYFLHPLLALTPERVPLGVVSAELLCREPDSLGNPGNRKQKPIEEKESYRWLKGYQESCKVAEQCPDTQVVMIADRESDIYEIFAEASKNTSKKGARWLIRAKHNRAIEDGEKRTKKAGRVYPKLFDEVCSTQPLGEVEFELKASHGRKQRVVTLSVYAKKVVLRPPERRNLKLQAESIWVICAKEENPPKGVDAVEWFLITDIPVRSFRRAAELIHWYTCRWQIEIFFRVLKSGCKIEELQLTTIEQLFPCITLYMIVAWRVLFLTMLGRECPDLPCDIVFDEIEWKAAYIVTYRKEPPSAPPSLNEILNIVAGFGGYLGRKNDPPPGAKAIWIGIQRNRDFAFGIMAAQGIDPKVSFPL